ncbi:MAG: hypothetical protein JO056_08575 [Alphaproteobacteria bacterium]|nr:hypothetical protein [Alphaproteobacteria bacterium]
MTGIIAVANQRFFIRDAIDGSPASQGKFIQVTLRYNLNTLEQTVLAAIAWTGLSLQLPHAQLKLIPAMACAFLVGRALFWIGYLVMPVLRAFGLGLTAYPTFAALIWLTIRTAAA